MSASRYSAVLLISGLLAASCQVIHVSPTHNTACFKDKKQFEGGANVGFSGGNINLAYSPVKYLSTQLNGYIFPASTRFNYNAEAGLGFYLPFPKLTVGLNAGYGRGAELWRRQVTMSETYAPVQNTRLDYDKAFAQLFVGFNDANESIFQGVSVKLSYFYTHYYYVDYLHDTFDRSNVWSEQNTTELNYFLKLRTGKSTFFTLNAGVAVYGKNTYDNILYCPVLRLGMLYKI